VTDSIQINAVANLSAATTTQKVQQTRSEGSQSFADALAEVQGVKFSNHAQKRLQQRNINLSDDGLTRLANAVDKADKRGGRESLIMVDDMAFIVNVKDRTVVTALDSTNRGDGVFTQIDSVVFAEPNTAQSDSQTPS
jgi:flagellar operon protein